MFHDPLTERIIPFHFRCCYKWKSGNGGQFLFRGDASQGCVGPFVAVGPQPSRGKFLYLHGLIKRVLIKLVALCRPIIAHDIGILFGGEKLNVL